ncbi:hypothetical protein NDU88_003335 [Pleurodeles waltl]|uniref:Uncharacterized protein n=1 Tax=Pleurodeles waltl TaxID=8319 RepID=A0AAV7Q952_PLEWA|nr:hypothetical protein NDU88_003335 [Pleurodeles waltl]
MDDRLRKVEDDIIQKKAPKLNRDKIDYKTGQIYMFAKKFDHWRKLKLSGLNIKVLNQTTFGTNIEASKSSDTDADESTRIKLHTTLQEEFDFLQRDRKTNHRPWRGMGRLKGRGTGRREEVVREKEFHRDKQEKVTRSNRHY